MYSLFYIQHSIYLNLGITNIFAMDGNSVSEELVQHLSQVLSAFQIPDTSAIEEVGARFCQLWAMYKKLILFSKICVNLHSCQFSQYKIIIFCVFRSWLPANCILACIYIYVVLKTESPIKYANKFCSDFFSEVDKAMLSWKKVSS